MASHIELTQPIYEFIKQDKKPPAIQLCRQQQYNP